jgi:hypothetical protein
MTALTMKTPGSGALQDDILDGIAIVDNKQQLKYMLQNQTKTTR